jgi:TPP-dependent trihydroxycyclohexane-1,2-dione (THcHDO) dehydratase
MYATPPGSNTWWDVEVAEVTGDETTRNLRAEYEEYRDSRRRYHY